MAQWLKQCGIRTVAMQSTGVYWIAVFDILEAAGAEVYLVNARETKNLPGRESDVQESQWLMKLHTYGLLRNSFRHAQLMFRVIDLPYEVDLSKAKATFNDSTLEVVMPRAAPAKSLQVKTRPALSGEGDTSTEETGGTEGSTRAVTGANEPLVKGQAASSRK